MGKAFDKNILIFLEYELPININYRDELLTIKPIVIADN